MLQQYEGVQLLQEMKHEIVVTARGESLQETISKLFQIMRKQIFQEIKQPIIQMEAEEVYFEDIMEQTRTEHFMFFFWPKERTSYAINEF